MGFEQLGSSSHPTTGGDGPNSYAQNSWYQKGGLDAVKEKIIEVITNGLDFKALKLGSSNAIKIVDMGCSIGTNTFIAIQNIIDAVKKTHQTNEAENLDSPLEFHIYFNDQSNNDFNTLFKTIPAAQNYFAAGVPGSFYRRLFPRSSLHIVHTSYSLNWLSKAPPEVMDCNSPAWNKDSVYPRGSVREVSEAYWAQCKNDMESFLDARAQEIVPGGLMIVLIAGLPNGIPACETAPGVFFDFIGSCLIDMAKMQETISEAVVDNFNLPVYLLSPKELEEIVQRNGYFTIERMDLLNIPIKDTAPSGEQFVQLIRAVIEGHIREHFGDELVDEIFNFCVAKFTEKPINFEDHKKLNRFDLFTVLQRVTK